MTIDLDAMEQRAREGASSYSELQVRVLDLVEEVKRLQAVAEAASDAYKFYDYGHSAYSDLAMDRVGIALDALEDAK